MSGPATDRDAGESPTWRALVLAGERPEGDALAAAEGAPAKAFIPIAGRPMIAHVLETLAALPEIGEIAVAIAPDAPALPEGAWQRLPAARGPSASVARGFAALGPPLLVATADHPMLSPATVRTFLASARHEDASAVAAVARAEVAARPPGAPVRTMMRFRDGAVTGCNLFALLNADAARVIAAWQRIEAERKSPVAMARAIGFSTAARYAAGRLSRRDGERALGLRFGVRVATVELDDPLAAHDVDRPAHLAFARRILEGG